MSHKKKMNSIEKLESKCRKSASRAKRLASKAKKARSLAKKLSKKAKSMRASNKKLQCKYIKAVKEAEWQEVEMNAFAENKKNAKIENRISKSQEVNVSALHDVIEDGATEVLIGLRNLINEISGGR